MIKIFSWERISGLLPLYLGIVCSVILALIFLFVIRTHPLFLLTIPLPLVVSYFILKQSFEKGTTPAILLMVLFILLIIAFSLIINQGE